MGVIHQARRLAERGWGYYRLYGFRRFFYAITTKLAARVSTVAQERVTAGGKLSSKPYRSFLLQTRLDRRPHRPANKVIRTPFTAVIGDLSLPQCKKYRVLQKLEALSHLNVAFDYSHYDDVPRSLNMIQFATFVIFYRTRNTDNFQLLRNECERLGIPYAYDIDDPIFSRRIYSKNANLEHLTSYERGNLLDSCEEHLAALRACRIGIVSTPRLAAEFSAQGVPEVFLWRNAIDSESRVAIASARALAERPIANRREDELRIVYASGSRAHEADFRQIEEVLFRVMERCDNVSLHIIGYLELPPSLNRFGDRIEMQPFGDYAAYIRKLAECHIALVPLVVDDFNDCKSAIRYMEAAQVETPCVASATGDFTELVTDGIDGFLAATPREWEDKLLRLVENPELRRSMARAACEMTSARLTVSAVTAGLDGRLKDYLHGAY